ncbi:MAG: PaaI family thioesterase [Alphaproteobacteria bacterium]
MTDFEARDLTEGLNGFLGFRLMDWKEGFAQIAVDIEDRHRNRQGGIHGGITASLIDAATGFCGVYEPNPDKRRGNVTVSLNVNFVGRAKGDTLICTAKTIRAGRRIYFASGEVRDEHENLVASAEAVYAYVDRDAQRRPTTNSGS